MDRNEKALSLMLSIMLLSLIAIAVLFFSGCISAPEKKDYADRPKVCFDAVVCMYYNHKNPDKSVCAKAIDECLRYERMINCKDKTFRPEEMKFQECWDKLD